MSLYLLSIRSMGPTNGRDFAQYFEDFKKAWHKDPRPFQEVQREALAGMEATAKTLEDLITLYRAAVGDIWNPLYLSTCSPSVRPISDFEVAARARTRIKELGGEEP